MSAETTDRVWQVYQQSPGKSTNWASPRAECTRAKGGKFFENSSKLSRCVQGNKWSTHWTFIGKEESLLCCSLQWCEF